MVKEIKLKLDTHWFDKVKKGKKKFEVRLGDKNIEEGDILVLLEKDKKKGLTGREIRKKVDSILNLRDIDYWPQEEVKEHGFVIASLS